MQQLCIHRLYLPEALSAVDSHRLHRLEILLTVDSVQWCCCACLDFAADMELDQGMCLLLAKLATSQDRT